ncbi:hypothetical protein Tco_0967071 [Tanacetum coccineum]
MGGAYLDLYKLRILGFVKDSGKEEPCRYVHHVGDEREVEALRSFNWPPRILMNGGVEAKREDTSTLIIKQRVKVNQKARILELKRRNHEEHCSDNLYAVSIMEDTAYPCPKHHSASTKRRSIPNLLLEMKDRNMTMEEYVQYEIEKALRNGKVYNWETATYGKIRFYVRVVEENGRIDEDLKLKTKK